MDTKIISEINDAALGEAAEIIRAGGLVAFPTETVYGLGANALDPEAAKKIYAAKGRPSTNPLIIHIADPRDAEEYCFTNDIYYKLAERFMPGPLTVILPKKPNIPYEVTGGLDTVAIRVPALDIARRFIKKCGLPIAAPSANLSTKPSPTRAQHVVRDLYSLVDMIIEGPDCELGIESTIITLATETPMLLRPGVVTAEQLKEICPELKVSDAVLGQHSGRPESPGMMFKHYTPNANVTLLCGTDKARYKYLENRIECGILCYDEDVKLLKMPYAKSLGAKGDALEQARMLFARLREYDEMEHIKQIYAPMPQSNGVGLALVNRLIRAAGFETIELEKE